MSTTGDRRNGFSVRGLLPTCPGLSPPLALPARRLNKSTGCKIGESVHLPTSQLLSVPENEARQCQDPQGNQDPLDTVTHVLKFF